MGITIGDARLGNTELGWSTLAIMFPMIFGIANLVTVWLPTRMCVLHMAAIGATLGLLLSSLGVFLLDYPGTLFGLHEEERYLILIAGPIFYGIIWAYPMRWINIRETKLHSTNS